MRRRIRAPIRSQALEGQGSRHSVVIGRCPDLHGGAAAQIHALAEALLVERAGGDAEQADDAERQAEHVAFARSRASARRRDRNPRRPSASPAHCRPLTRSPSSGPATAAISSGCRLTIKALVAGADAARDRDVDAAQIEVLSRQPATARWAERPRIARPAALRATRATSVMIAAVSRKRSGQEGERLGMRQAELRADEAGAPQHDEQYRG